MKMTDYKETKLAIFEKAANGEISDEDKSKLLTMLEAKKDAETLSKDDIDKFFKNLKDMYPDFEKDIDKLVKKLDDDEEDDEEDDKEDDMEDSEDSEDADDTVEESVQPSEKALELFSRIENLS